MGEIKSAFEIAMEKAAQLEKPSEEESLKWKYLPEGQRLAAAYLKDEENLLAELSKHGEKERKWLAKGAEEALLSNVNLPVNEIARKNAKKAMEGVKGLKKDKSAAENVLSKMRRVFEHYEKDGEQQRRQAYDMLKQNFQMKLQQAMQQQGLPPGTRVDVERHPQFQDEWRRTQSQLDSQYLRLLEEYKQELSNIK